MTKTVKLIVLLAGFSVAAQPQSLPQFTISTVAGDGTAAYSGDGGSATSADLDGAQGVTVDAAGNLYFAEFFNNRVRKVTPGGIITTFAGTGNGAFSGDGGPATEAALSGPSRALADGSGNLYIADSGNHRVRKVAPDGTITTVAGNGNPGNDGDGGAATSASIDSPGDLALDNEANLYFGPAPSSAAALRALFARSRPAE